MTQRYFDVIELKMPVRALTAELAAKAASEDPPHKNVREAVEVVRQSVS